MQQENKMTQAPMKKRRGITKTDVQQFLLRGRAFIALILVTVVFTSLSPQFMTTDNIVIMSKHVAINALLAIGMTFVVLTGGIDLSVGSIVGMIAMIAGGLINEGINLPQLGIIIYPHTWMIIVLSLALGTLMGAISGFVTHACGVCCHHPPAVWTSRVCDRWERTRGGTFGCARFPHQDPRLQY
jgi:erythritol transport system permease protein